MQEQSGEDTIELVGHVIVHEEQHAAHVLQALDLRSTHTHRAKYTLVVNKRYRI